MNAKLSQRNHRPRPAPFCPKTRWAAWEAGVLSCVRDPASAQKLIIERQKGLDDDAALG